MNLKALRMSFEFGKESICSGILENMFNNNRLKDGFKKANVTVSQIQNYLNRPSIKRFNDPAYLDRELEELQNFPALIDKIAFFKKWGSFIKAGLIQGLDDTNECLGEGVCWGNTQRMRLNAQSKVNLTREEFIKEVQLVPQDRYLQGMYASNRKLAGEISHQLPKHLLDSHGYDEDKELLFVQCNITEKGFNPRLQNRLKEGIKKKVNDLKGSNGWAILGLSMEGSGHATLMRLKGPDNEEPHYAWFMDPNFGLFCFEENRTFEEAQNLFCEFIVDLFKMAYPDIHRIRAYMLHKK